MTAVTVAPTTDYISGAPDNYASINNQEPTSATLSNSDLWLVDPTQLEGETSDTLFPDISVTNLSETPDGQLVVPFDNINYEEPEITLSSLTSIQEETFDTSDPLSDAVQVAAVTGNVELASDTPSTSVDETSTQLAGSSVETSFASTSTGDSGSGSVETLSSALTGGSSGESTTSTGDTSGETTATGETTTSETPTGETTATSGTTTSETLTGETTATGDTTTSETLTGETTATGDTTTNETLTAGTNTTGDTTATGDTTTGQDPLIIAQAEQIDPSQNPADVPFSFTESLGIIMLLCVIGGHKFLRTKNRSVKAAN